MRINSSLITSRPAVRLVEFANRARDSPLSRVHHNGADQARRPNLSMRYTDCPADAGIEPSVGTAHAAGATKLTGVDQRSRGEAGWCDALWARQRLPEKAVCATQSAEDTARDP